MTMIKFQPKMQTSEDFTRLWGVGYPLAIGEILQDFMRSNFNRRMTQKLPLFGVSCGSSYSPSSYRTSVSDSVSDSVLGIATSGWYPALEVYEDKDSLSFNFEAPGVNKEDFGINYHEGVLTVTGRRSPRNRSRQQAIKRVSEASSSESSSSCSLQEKSDDKSYESFSRSVSVPVEIRSEQISASYKDGILEVRLPKAEKAKPTKIEVNVP